MNVKELLYSANVEDQWKGIDIVDAWSCRQLGLPVSVESTALFSSLIIRMEACAREGYASSATSEYTQLLYAASLAMIRMVNGIIDAEQKGAYSKSVNVIAEEIGIPRFFVDLRHRCTHADLPSFDILLSGLNNGKHWLYDFYWMVFAVCSC